MSGGGGFGRAKTELKWMRFVDGENLVFQGGKFLSDCFPDTFTREPVKDYYKISFKGSSPFFKEEKFLWIPAHGCSALTNYNLPAQWGETQKENSQMPEAIRAHYYTIVSGQKEEVVPSVKETIWKIGFTPQVMWKEKSRQKSKSVDSAISAGMLSAASKNQYDLVEIWAGDSDYLSLVEEVKSLGKIVVCCFFGEKYGLSTELKIACDQYRDISELMNSL